MQQSNWEYCSNRSKKKCHVICTMTNRLFILLKDIVFLELVLSFWGFFLLVGLFCHYLKVLVIGIILARTQRTDSIAIAIIGRRKLG